MRSQFRKFGCTLVDWLVFICLSVISDENLLIYLSLGFKDNKKMNTHFCNPRHLKAFFHIWEFMTLQYIIYKEKSYGFVDFWIKVLIIYAENLFESHDVFESMKTRLNRRMFSIFWWNLDWRTQTYVQKHLICT